MIYQLDVKRPIFKSKQDAETALGTFIAITNQRGFVTVSNLYSISGMETSEEDKKWGWKELYKFHVYKDEDFTPSVWSIEIPAPILLDHGLNEVDSKVLYWNVFDIDTDLRLAQFEIGKPDDADAFHEFVKRNGYEKVYEQVSSCDFTNKDVYVRRTKEMNDTYSVKKVSFETKQDAYHAFDDLLKICAGYGHITVADLYDTAGIPFDWRDNCYGWHDLTNFKIGVDSTSLKWAIKPGSAPVHLDRTDDGNDENITNPNVARHQKICRELNKLYERKNHDYGDSFHETWLEEGYAMARIRLSDKLSRFKQLTKPAKRLQGYAEAPDRMVTDESIRDTLIDLANYAIMTVMEMDQEKGCTNNE